MNVYDFDGTIYDGDSTVDFYIYTLKKQPSLLRYVPKQAMGFVLYEMKRIKKTRLKEYFFSFLNGIDTEKLVDGFWNENERKIYSWYKNQQNTDDIIISASPDFLFMPICKRLGIQYLIASKVDVVSGHFTGENCYGKEKVRRLESTYKIRNIDKFYSDSTSDLPLADIAKEAFLVKKGKVTKWGREGYL